MSSQTPASARGPGSPSLTPATKYRAPRPRDPNIPDSRLQVGAKCVYERALPGGSYITAHACRLQSGYYDSPVIHEDYINHVRFIALSFVFHEASSDRRFKSARIRLSIHDENRPHATGNIVPVPLQLNLLEDPHQQAQIQRPKPKFLRYAPHLLFGAITPATLKWNFNLAGSLGVSELPVSASLNPSVGYKTSHKVYKMMEIQGSLRTNNSWFGKNYDVEDGELVWTLEENYLQKSGLPREFTFVVLLTKGHELNHVKFEIDIVPEIALWFGEFPRWWINLLKYQPLYKEPLDMDKGIGQKFEPDEEGGEKGFNFARLMTSFDDFVTLPGTTYSTQDWGSATEESAGVEPDGAPEEGAAPVSVKKDKPQAKQQSKTSTAASGSGAEQEMPFNTVHLRIQIEPQPPKTSYAISSHLYSEPTTTPLRSPPSSQPGSTLAPAPAPAPAFRSPAQHRSTPNSQSKPSRPARRVTVGGSPASTPHKQRPGPRSHLATQHEEREDQTSSNPKTSSHSEENEEDCEFSFPESISPAKSPPQGQPQMNSRHRQTKSTSTTSSSLFEPSHPDRTFTTSHSLRRTHSRSGLRSASISSQHPPPSEPDPESEVAISAAMDMLTGSPPPPCASPVPAAPDPPPVFGPAPTLITTRRHGVGPVIKTGDPTSVTDTNLHRPDMSLATPRTRAALADRMEIERAERERFERRNGHKDSHHQSVDNDPTQKLPQTPLEERNRRLRPSITSRRSSARSNSGNPTDISEEGTNHRSSIGSRSKIGVGVDDNFVVTDSKERERGRDREKIRQKRYSLPVTSTGIGYPSSRSTNVAAGGSSREDTQPDRSRYENGEISDRTLTGTQHNGDASNSKITGGPADPSSEPRIGLGVNNNPTTTAIGNGRSSLMIPIGGGGVARNKKDIGPRNMGIRNHAAETGVLGTSHSNFDTNNTARTGNLGSGTGTGTGGGGGGFIRRDDNAGVYSGYEYIG